MCVLVRCTLIYCGHIYPVCAPRTWQGCRSLIVGTAEVLLEVLPIGPASSHTVKLPLPCVLVSTCSCGSFYFRHPPGCRWCLALELTRVSLLSSDGERDSSGLLSSWFPAALFFILHPTPALRACPANIFSQPGVVNRLPVCPPTTRMGVCDVPELQEGGRVETACRSVDWCRPPPRTVPRTVPQVSSNRGTGAPRQFLDEQEFLF